MVMCSIYGRLSRVAQIGRNRRIKMENELFHLFSALPLFLENLEIWKSPVIQKMVRKKWSRKQKVGETLWYFCLVGKNFLLTQQFLMQLFYLIGEELQFLPFLYFVSKKLLIKVGAWFCLGNGSSVFCAPPLFRSLLVEVCLPNVYVSFYL